MANKTVERLFRNPPDWLFELGLEFPEDLEAYLDTAIEKAIINHERKIAGKAPLFGEMVKYHDTGKLVHKIVVVEDPNDELENMDAEGNYFDHADARRWAA